jgi:hypothetical protein
MEFEAGTGAIEAFFTSTGWEQPNKDKTTMCQILLGIMGKSCRISGLSGFGPVSKQGETQAKERLFGRNNQIPETVRRLVPTTEDCNAILVGENILTFHQHKCKAKKPWLAR